MGHQRRLVGLGSFAVTGDGGGGRGAAQPAVGDQLRNRGLIHQGLGCISTIGNHLCKS